MLEQIQINSDKYSNNLLIFRSALQNGVEGARDGGEMEESESEREREREKWTTWTGASFIMLKYINLSIHKLTAGITFAESITYSHYIDVNCNLLLCKASFMSFAFSLVYIRNSGFPICCATLSGVLSFRSNATDRVTQKLNCNIYNIQCWTESHLRREYLERSPPPTRLPFPDPDVHATWMWCVLGVCVCVSSRHIGHQTLLSCH